MYQPGFNSVLVEIDDRDAKWGGGNDESMLGKSFRKGKIVAVGGILSTQQYPKDLAASELVPTLVGSNIMWNEGTEAGTTWDEGGKQYGFIYWWDIRGVKE